VAAVVSRRTGLASRLETHEMRFAEEISSKVFFTENGVIVEQGTPQQIFHSPVNERTIAFVSDRAAAANGRAPVAQGL
jgi:polar amino acid transport system ATP-binding protein